MARSGNVYNTQKTCQAESDIQFLLRAHISKENIQITSKPVIVKIRFNYSYPKSMSKNDKLLADLEMLYRASRPDVDNLAKLVLDSMNGLIYFDDGQVVRLVCEKKYSKREGIDLKVIEI
jgi:Holliday junction resolvase RusA-like endonuclease